MASIFSRIYNGEIPGYFVARNEEFFAILDINPLTMGHVLVIPIVEADYLFDLDAEFLARYMAFTQKIAKAIKAVIDCKRVGVAVIGLEVPHTHIHLIPINILDDMNFSKEKMSPSQEELAHTASILLKA